MCDKQEGIICAQDTPNSQNLDTQCFPVPSSGNSEKCGTDTCLIPTKCSNNYFKYESSACPSGFSLSPDVKKDICNSGFKKCYLYQATDLAGNIYWPGIIIPQGCSPGIPDTIESCCADMPDHPTSSCPQGYCINSNPCIDVMKNVCTKNLNDEKCQKYLHFSANSYGRQEVTKAILETMPTDPLKFNTRLGDIISTCKIAPPGSCDDYLKEKCKNYTREELATDASLESLCGCFLSDSEYEKYKYITAGKTECDPACTNDYALKRGKKCQFVRCKEPQCIIDFRDENVKNNYKNGIDISQNCGYKNSICYLGLSASDAEEIKSQGIKLKQKNCDSCFLWDPSDPKKMPVKLQCSNIIDSALKAYKENPDNSKNINWTLIGGILITGLSLILILLIMYFILKK